MSNSGANVFPATSGAGNKLAVTTFVVSGGIGTFPAGYNFNFVPSQSINVEGAITGTYYAKVPITSTSFYAALHGFVREPDGKFLLFDAPNAINTFNAGTTPEAINDGGDIAGTFQDMNLAYHAFFRRRDGALTVIDVPEASATLAVGINSLGEVVGNYIDHSSSMSHGFIRSPDGALTLIDPSGVGTFGSYPSGINSGGTVTGTYFDSNYDQYGFVRYRDGTYVSFAITDPADGTAPTGIDDSGRIIGYAYGAAPDYLTHSFLRYPDGTYSLFDPVGATASVATGTNFEGAVVGTYEENSSSFNYLRIPNGTIQALSLPGFAQAINFFYEIPGFYYDSPSNTFIGFVAKPGYQ